jgi:subtilase family serine protease
MRFSGSSQFKFTLRSSARTCLFAVLATMIFTVTAMAQAAQQRPVLKAPSTPYATNTPQQVVLGTVKVVQAYNPTSKLRVAISIKAPKMAEEEDFLKELQDKTSPNFHKYLTPEEWNARFAPAAEDEQAVVDWVKSQGLTVTARYPNRLMVDAEGTVDAIQKAFSININKYEVNGEIEFSNDRDPQIPSNLAGIIQYVDGLNSILRMRPANSHLKGMRGPDYSPGPVRQEGAGGQQNANPAAVKALASKMKAKSGAKQLGSQITGGFYDPSDVWSSNMYDFNALQAQGHCCNPTGNSGGTPPQTSIGLATDGAFAASDMTGFQAQYPYLAYHYYTHFVDGTPSCCDDETTLDLEWSTATSNSRGSYQDTSSIHVYETATGFGTFGDIFQQMLTDNVVNVVNISYGLNEDYLNGLGLVSSWHGMFNQMIGQGWTIMAAAGDNGAVAGCSDSIAVLYPESDPDIVSVGGTQLALNSDGSFNSEVTWTGDTFSGACSENDGGTGGGCSNLFAAPGYQQGIFQSSPACGTGSRSVPDIALHSSPHPWTNFFFNGELEGIAGTSLASPEMSGFVAQANAYLLAIGLGGSPLGQLDYKLYYLGTKTGNSYEAHYPYYDVLSGCNSNDVTAEFGTGAYCAGTGYDLTTGWGSFNALQLAWGINTYDLGDFGAPVITFSGPSHTQGADNWYNTDQTVSWTIADTASGGLTATGVSGFSAAWDNYFFDSISEATPGSGNPFYSGPEYPNQTTGSLDLASAGQGCHFATVNAWDNSGFTSGDNYYYYLCYDTVPPVTTDTLSGTFNGTAYTTPVKVTLSASDATSGVAHTYYYFGTSSPQLYSAPFTVSSLGGHTLHFYSTDVAGNTESVHTIQINIESPTTTTLTSGANPSVYFQTVTYTATVAGSFGGTPTGFVTFKADGVSMGPSAAVNSSGVATLTFYKLVAGTHSITATYGGSGKNVSSASATLMQTVDKASTTTKLVSSLNPSKSGQSVTFTATVTGEFGGNTPNTLKFKDGSTFIATVTTNATTHQATFTTSSLSVGTHNITAVYEGGSNLHGSTSPVLKQVVNK